MRNKKTSNLVIAAIFIAIILLLAFTPGLGYIPLGAIRVTTIHIPVIIGAALLGPKYGATFGFVFGLTSFINNTISPIATSFVFTPFYSIGEVKGNFWSIVICFLPRILIGVVSYYVFDFVKRILKQKKGNITISFIFAGIAGSLTNTILVMNMIYIFFGKQYSNAIGKAYHALYSVIIGVIGFNGVLEAITAAVIVSAVGTVLFKVKKTYTY